MTTQPTTHWPRHYGDRLMRLAKFLEKLPRRKFDFGAIVRRSEVRGGQECGTVCCAMGWMPAVFPHLISWSDLMQAREGVIPVFDIAQRLFGLTLDERGQLFSGLHSRLPWAEGQLTYEATPKQVARSIRAFVAWKRGQAR